MSKISAKLRQLEATVEAAKRDGIANDAILYAVQYGLEPRDDESHIEPAVQAIWEEAGFLAWRGVDFGRRHPGRLPWPARARDPGRARPARDHPRGRRRPARDLPHGRGQERARLASVMTLEDQSRRGLGRGGI